MKQKVSKRILSMLLAVVMIFCMLPTLAFPAFAWDIYVECEFCGEGAGDEWICSGGDHCGPDSGRDCWEENHCQICHECANNTEFCEDCKMCVECARDNKVHCLGCGECGMDTDLCPNCGQCYDSCGGMCSEGTDHLCYDCHLEEDADLICEDCGACFVDGASGRRCGICGGCMNCNGRCDSDEEHACLECHLEENMACPNCGDCYVDNEQETCPDCGSCYSCAEFICKDCGRCNDCVYDICDHCGEMCIDCHENEGGLCPDCGMCGGGDPVCDECGGCTWCYWICSVCGLCGECCWDYHCPECDACYLEVDRCLSGGEHCTLCCEENGWLCPECGECIEGNGYELVCRDCGACEGCSEFCDTCGDDICLDCLMNEESLHCPECGICFYDTRNCHECGLCENCVELCEYCWDYCMDCAADLGFHCSGCGVVCFDSGDPYCEGCELCADCVDEYCYHCERCVECTVDEEMHCPDCYRCFTADVYECEYGCGYCEYCCRCGYTVSFDANGGIGTMSDVKVYGAYVLPECGFISPNSIFSAWKVNGVNRSVGDTVIITEDTVITAVWRRTVNPVTPYSISFRANGGSGTMDAVSLYSSKYVLPACQFTAPRSGRDVMVFAGWRVNDIQGTLPAGTPIDITGDTVLTAVWTETTFDTYTVFFDANGGTGIFGPVYRSAGTYTLPKCFFTAPVGKQFKAWNVNGVEYAPGKIITISSNTTVKAVWVDIYVVVFDANGGNGTMEPYAMTKGAYTLPECSFEAPAGKQFEGWRVGTKEYAPGEKITVSAHTSVIARWETAFSGAVLSGTVTSFGDANGDITLQLIEQGLTEPAYETVVKGNTVNYSFASVAAGTYTLKVSKANHVTREYTVVVGTDEVTQDAKIHLKGDINGDGRVNVSDVGLANAHAKKVSSLEGYQFDCANVNGDARITISDVGLLNAHSKKTSLLW